MFSVRLRHRVDPMTSAPRASAYSAMWLPTNPVMPVMSNRMAFILHEHNAYRDFLPGVRFHGREDAANDRSEDRRGLLRSVAASEIRGNH